MVSLDAGTGIGRAWPLLTGERAHYEMAAGRPHAAEQLAHALEAFAGDSGLLPEQIWDSADIPERELFLGSASGSAMPLVWAHAEHLKLCRSLRDGEVSIGRRRQLSGTSGRSRPRHAT